MTEEQNETLKSLENLEKTILENKDLSEEKKKESLELIEKLKTNLH